MVKVPSGLLTCLLKDSVLRTMDGAVAAVTGTLFADAFMIDSKIRRCAWVLVALLATGAHAAAPAPARPAAPTILVFGDSLSAGYGINVTKGWVALLAQRLEAQGYGYRVVNASVSGETTGGGRTRLPRALDLHKPDIAILELGSNDGLRGLPLEQMRANLEAMIQLAKGRGAYVLVAGMQMPPNYGATYTTGFRNSFSELAERHQVSLVPFFMEGIALKDELMQADDLHPNEAGQPLLLDNVWPFLEPLLKRNVNVQRSAPVSGSGAAVR
jgi:acyl-CoA thioesterase-1